MKKAEQLYVTIFLSAINFSETLLPAPEVPQMKICGFGKFGGPINVFKYIGAFV